MPRFELSRAARKGLCALPLRALPSRATPLTSGTRYAVSEGAEPSTWRDRLPHDRFQAFRGNAARVREIDLVVFAGKPKLLLLGKGLHYGHGLALLFVRPDMQHLHAAPLSQGFQPHTLNVLPFAPFEQHGDGLAEVVVLDEIRPARSTIGLRACRRHSPADQRTCGSS